MHHRRRRVFRQGAGRVPERLGRDRYLDLLNTFFEQVSDVCQEHGGEVLKFIGDAVLAIFPSEADESTACSHARDSAVEILNRISNLRETSDHDQLDCAIGIDFGEVTYGNVGSRDRLDFTVIGNAANVAARLADLSKRVGQKVVMSKNAARNCQNGVALGSYELRNVSELIECFGIEN